MIKPFNIPRGILDIFKLGECGDMTITEFYANRPDKILEQEGSKSVRDEIVNNNISNTSPISLKVGDEYTICGFRLKKYFQR